MGYGDQRYKHVILYDEDGNLYNVENPIPVMLDDVKNTVNAGDNLRTSNLTQEQVLINILKELKKMNLHLSILTDNDIKNTEV